MSDLSVAIIVPVLNEEKHLADVYEAIKSKRIKTLRVLFFHSVQVLITQLQLQDRLPQQIVELFSWITQQGELQPR